MSYLFALGTTTTNCAIRCVVRCRGKLLQDLTFIEDGNLDYVVQHMLNFEKRSMVREDVPVPLCDSLTSGFCFFPFVGMFIRDVLWCNPQLYDVLTNIRKAQMMQYSFRPRKNVTILDSLQPLSENELYDLSLKYEPRGARRKDIK